MKKTKLFEIKKYFDEQMLAHRYGIYYKGNLIDDGTKKGGLITTSGTGIHEIEILFDVKIKDFPDNLAFVCCGKEVFREFTWDRIKKENGKISIGFCIFRETFEDSIYGYNYLVEIIEFEIFKFPCFSFDINYESMLDYTIDYNDEYIIEHYYEIALKELKSFFNHVSIIIANNLLEETKEQL